MVNKVFAGLVIAFWAAMMTALVRLDVFPVSTTLETVSTERVLKKIFSSPEPVRLGVYYNNSRIGVCRIDLQPVDLNDDRPEEMPPGAKADGYKVTSDLKVRLLTFGMPERLWLRGESSLNSRLELEHFEFKTFIGDGRGSDGHISVIGDSHARKVQVVFDYAGMHDERSYDFNQVAGNGFAGTFGLPGMASFGVLGGGLPGSSAGPAGDGTRSPPVTTTYIDRLEVAGNAERVYLIYSKIDDQMWTKLWVDDSGQILKLVTSLGLEMRSDVAFGADSPSYPTGRRAHWWQ
jgi:hypothetical protein